MSCDHKLIQTIGVLLKLIKMSLLSGYRDPFRSVIGDVWTDTDPFSGFGVTTGLLPSSTNLRQNRGVQLGRMICCNAFELDNEFKVICEVSLIYMLL